MFGLIRRISQSVIPRPDRPWDDDATSNAPKTGRKRRFSTTEDLDDDPTNNKKIRGDSPATPVETPLIEKEVKAVTKGVKEVDLGDKEAAPENIPLPEEEPGELDEGASTDSIASTPPAEESDAAPEDLSAVADDTPVGDDKVAEKAIEIVKVAAEKMKANVPGDDVKAGTVAGEKTAVDTSSSRDIPELPRQADA
ncbi:uncharacterized protein BT62DRAFT_981197 [Guyanagaster necrorhizus]|uniref:Uncharacterized protein n=1 Tax=Guyanagaster necrorhizus TaxID=856835 RepID=A0A9P7VR81_9AGAR|nr:uncharacterized protein BT62DRAFT_981197 [Guyanagaster necrorhizus MCA 3950]KAG7445225.1 hypothetical protein BT62DRAFT_981197 [Guyanagaster necrorhizus MCA 3950]